MSKKFNAYGIPSTASKGGSWLALWQTARQD